MGNFNQGGRSWGGRDNKRGGGGFDGGGGFRDRDRSRPQMHQATCADCGNRCEVPFKPTGDKPVYCSNCFESSGRGMSRPKRDDARPRFEERPKADSGEIKAEMEKLNNKLDRILKILAPVVSSEPVKKEDVNKESVKKTSAKKKEKPAEKPAKKSVKKTSAKKK